MASSLILNYEIFMWGMMNDECWMQMIWVECEMHDNIWCEMKMEFKDKFKLSPSTDVE
jgi:hypothetical protein